MAIYKGFRCPIEFADAFPQGLVLVGELAPDNDYQSQEDRAVMRPVRQNVYEVTRKRQWKGTATDPDESNSKRAPFEPRIAGNGEVKYQTYIFRATGFASACAAGGSKSPQASKPVTESIAKAA